MNLKNFFIVGIILLTGFVGNSQYNVLFDITTDEYSEETTYMLESDSETLVDEGPLTDDETTYPTETWDLPAGTYTFSIQDAYGDGICCGFGDGGFTLTDETSGLIIAQGGDFGDEFTVTFTQPYVPPIFGCTDPTAFNFFADAESDDGSCIYESGQPVIALLEVANGIDNPVDITNAGDDRLFVVEQDGVIVILDDEYNEIGEFLDIDSQVASGGERGLLGLAFDPNYIENGYFYVNYTDNGGDSRISRFTVSSDPNVADEDSELIILEQDQPFANHNAGDLAFGADGFLYIPFGDGGSGEDPQDNGQSTDTWLGKMLRIDVAGADEISPYLVPDDNPFVGDLEYLPEIWAVGLRNTWRFSFDAETGDMWMGDVGQYTWEEIDIEAAGDVGGKNYGWRCYEGNHEFNTFMCAEEDEMTFPIYEYNHSGGACSVTGGFVYRGDEYATLDGVYIFVDYCNGIFRGLRDEDGTYMDYVLLGSQGFGWTTFGQNNAFDMFVGNSDGTIHKIIDPCGDFTAEITISGDSLVASDGEYFAWVIDDEVVAGFSNQSFNPDFGNNFQVAIVNDEGCTAFSDVILFNSIDVNTFDSEIQIYPNPVNDLLIIEISGNISERTFNIIDVSGKLINSWTSSDSNNQIDVSDLSIGNYVLRVENESGVTSKSFVKE